MPIYMLRDDYEFPPVDDSEDSGLLAIGGDLSVGRLLEAYRHGVFPWYAEGDPILWWSPDPRTILIPEKIHVSKRLRRTLKSSPFRITYDTAFTRVLDECAAPGGPERESTWITQEMRSAYIALHEEGYAHSVEVWDGEDLVGGLYGVSVGHAFFGESMFTRASNASKLALIHLARRLSGWGFGLIDCQMTTDHLLSMGAEEVSREAFVDLLDGCTAEETRRGSWTE